MLRIAFFINGGQSFSGKIPWWNERLIKNPNGCFRALFILLYPRYEAPNDLRIEIRIIRSNWYRMSEAVSRQWRKVGPKAAKVQLNMNMSFKNLNGNTTRISTFVLIKISQFQGLPWDFRHEIWTNLNEKIVKILRNGSLTCNNVSIYS